MPLQPLHWSWRTRLAIVTGAAALHVAVFFLPLSSSGVYDTGFAVVPVLVASMLFGLRGGLIGALATIPLHMALFAAVGVFDFHHMSHVFFPEAFAVVVVGIGAGIARDYAVAHSVAGERWRQLIAATSDAVVVFDSATLQFIDCNQAALKLYGYSRGEFLKRTVFDVSIDPATTQASMGEIVRDGGTYIPLRYVRRSDGSKVPAEITATKLSQGPRTLVMGIVRDVSARLRADSEIQAARLAAVTAKAVATAQEDERRRIARGVHDGIGSSLATLLVEIQRISENESVTAPLRERLNETRKNLRAVIDETSRISRGLHPVTLDDYGLVAAVEQLTGDYRRVHQVEMTLVFRGFDGFVVPPEPALAVFRIIQEALSNAAKYANATSVGLVMETDRRNVRVTVEDNGRGFDTESHAGRGSGLRSMCDRALLLGGKVDIESIEGRGTTIFALIPLPENMVREDLSPHE